VLSGFDDDLRALHRVICGAGKTGAGGHPGHNH
jgi:hypothetical protein